MRGKAARFLSAINGSRCIAAGSQPGLAWAMQCDNGRRKLARAEIEGGGCSFRIRLLLPMRGAE